VDNDNDDEAPKASKLPAPTSEIETPAKDVPAAGEVSAPAELFLTESYMQKGIFFMILMLIVVYFARRRRSAYQKLNEKTMA
jgi:hypothetical protein